MWSRTENRKEMFLRLGCFRPLSSQGGLTFTDQTCSSSTRLGELGTCLPHGFSSSVTLRENTWRCRSWTCSIALENHMLRHHRLLLFASDRSNTTQIWQLTVYLVGNFPTSYFPPTWKRRDSICRIEKLTANGVYHIVSEFWAWDRIERFFGGTTQP